MLDNENKKIALILTSFTFGFGIFATIISLLVLIILIYHWFFTGIKQEDKITIFHCIHIYLSMLIFTTIMLTMNIRTILGDLNGQSFNSSSCIVSGYIAVIQLCTMYLAFAFYRLVRILYPQNRYFRSLKLYILLPIIEYVWAIGIQCVVITWNGVTYFINDSFCYVSFANIRAIIWAAFSAYLFPFLCSLMIYLRITTFLRHQTNNLTLLVKQRQDRDVLIVQRILIIITLLLILGVPSMYFIVRFAITGDDLPLTNRVAWFPVGISMAGLSVTLIFSIPQLKNIVKKLFQPHRVAITTLATLPGRIQMKTASGTE
ncbi:hypothetical protein I4U23_011732 [Adineta vaga]|nr:hypothetical protein I4U23_011732 [Adineta vaga]